ncbi:pectin methylesterase-like acyl-CoA thioesterase [Paenibacillus harenae]|nr:pectin methylesterase-like acyl-CoA thioesterase [Paenibacillus harenae]
MNAGQAVALYANADRLIARDVSLLGHQDTLYANNGRHYYVDSYIEGTVDFIFGNATAVFENSEIHSL